MNLGRQDLRAMKSPLVVLAVVLLTAAATIHFTYQDARSAQAQLERSRGMLAQAQQQLTRAGDDENLIKRYLPEYQKWQQRGFVGAEHRAEWLEALHGIADRMHLSGIAYSIEPRQPVTLSAPPHPGSAVSGDGGVRLYRSLMKLRIPLLHEEDLLRFLNALAAQQRGLFSVDECSLGRIEAATGLSGKAVDSQARLLAECALSWYTMGEERNGVAQ